MDAKSAKCNCLICMEILIEPVTLPCDHELCMPCFKRTVEEGLFTCPHCRRRASSWVRKATKTGQLINRQRWSEIQRVYPERVRKRLAGEDDIEEDDVFTPPLSLPGEIREEYEEEMRKMELEEERRRCVEEDASRQLIAQFVEEEERQKRQLEEDERLALELSQLVNQKSDTEEEKLACEISRLLSQSSTPKPSHTDPPTQPNYPDNCLDNFLSASTASSTSDLALTSDPNDLHFNDLYTDLPKSSSLTFDPDKLPSLPFVDIKEDSMGDCESLSIAPLPSTSSAHSLISLPPITNQMPCSTTPSSSPTTTNYASHSSTPHSECSKDSISPELVYFKPIHASPRTPPKGDHREPRLVFTTPRRLAMNGKSSSDASTPSTLNPELHSPMMRHRLDQLISERRKQVEDNSRATSTSPVVSSMESASPSQPMNLDTTNHTRNPIQSTSKPTNDPKFTAQNKDRYKNYSRRKRKAAKNDVHEKKRKVDPRGTISGWLELQLSSSDDPSPGQRDCNHNHMTGSCDRHSHSNPDFLLAKRLQEEFNREMCQVGDKGLALSTHNIHASLSKQTRLKKSVR